jgi:hypothetical protein
VPVEVDVALQVVSAPAQFSASAAAVVSFVQTESPVQKAERPVAVVVAEQVAPRTHGSTVEVAATLLVHCTFVPTQSSASERAVATASQSVPGPIQPGVAPEAIVAVPAAVLVHTALAPRQFSASAS